jgi:hypothetical protein
MNQKEFNQKFIEHIRRGENIEELLPLLQSFAKLPSSRALEVYREDYEARMSEALKNTYRKIHSVIGDEDFAALALSYLEHYPSTFSDLDEYGEKMEEFISRSTQLKSNFPFLSQLAHFEWSFRKIFHAKERPGLNPEELQASFGDEEAKLTFAPSCLLLAYDYAVEKIYSADEKTIPFDPNEQQFILMFKKESLVKIHLLSGAQHTTLKIFYTPTTLSACITKAPATMTPEEMRELFWILGREQILLKSL